MENVRTEKVMQDNKQLLKRQAQFSVACVAGSLNRRYSPDYTRDFVTRAAATQASFSAAADVAVAYNFNNYYN